MNVTELLTNHTYSMTLYGSVLIGLIAGALGTLAYLRKQSMISDVISHSALPGTFGAFLLLSFLGYSGRSMIALLIGAAATGVLAVWLTNLIPRLSVVKLDAAMAVVLSTFFGAGMLALDYISSRPIPDKGGVQDYLFGNASTLTRADLITSAVIGAVTLAVLGFFFKEFTARSFDPQLTQVMGLRVGLIDAVMFAAIVVATVIGLKSVGLVLMVAFVVTPPAIARQWTRSAATMTALSAGIGGVGSAIGTYVSIAYGPMPTGPAIVIALFIMLVASLALSPRRKNAMATA